MGPTQPSWLMINVKAECWVEANGKGDWVRMGMNLIPACSFPSAKKPVLEKRLFLEKLAKRWSP